MLLDLYASYMPEIGPMKRFKNKKEMWSNISTEICGKSAKQCEERFKTVMKRKKTAVENNNASGSKRQNIDYEDELSKIASIDDSIEPEVQMSSQQCTNKEAKQKPTEKMAKKKETVQSTLLEIAKMKEEGRERRHREKMQAVKDMEDILTKMLNNKN